MPAIEIRNIYKSFGPHVAIEDVSLSIEEGEIFGVLGPNGAGKTTTVECLTGMIRPEKGQIRVLGLDPANDIASLRRLVGYQLQSSELPDAMRVGEALQLFASFYPNPESIDELLETVGLSEQRNTAFGVLSGGQKQRLSIALALVGSPRIAVLDELTTGLDPQGRRDIWSLIRSIRQTGVTIVLVTHFLDEAEALCDRLAIIDHGRTITAGTPDEIIDLAPMPASDRRPSLEDAYLAIIDNDRVLRASLKGTL